MKYFLKTLYFVLLVLAVVLPSSYDFYGLGVVFSVGALIVAASILHPTLRQEGAYLLAPLCAFFWTGVAYYFPRQLELSLLALLFCGAGLMALAMMGGSFLWDGPDDPLERETPLIIELRRELVAEFSQSLVDLKQYKWSLKGVLQFAAWGCTFTSAALMLTRTSIVPALISSVVAIALTFSYDASSVGRVRSTYGAFASLCLIGVLGPWDLGLLPLILFVMMALMAVLTRS